MDDQSEIKICYRTFFQFWMDGAISVLSEFRVTSSVPQRHQKNVEKT